MEENGAHFFEGTEKLLEVWFSREQPSPQEPHQSKGSGDLRTIPRLARWGRAEGSRAVAGGRREPLWGAVGLGGGARLALSRVRLRGGRGALTVPGLRRGLCVPGVPA